VFLLLLCDVIYLLTYFLSAAARILSAENVVDEASKIFLYSLPFFYTYSY
jgi:hypothetical protein